jgi:FkbM family methyltransferase
MPLSLKPIIKRLISPLGFDIVSNSRTGLHVFNDVKRYLNGVHGKLQFLDVGANTGQTVAELLPQFPQCHIHAFEPTPEPFEALKELASGHRSRVSPHQIALSDHNGTAKFFLNSFSVTNSLLESAEDLSEYRSEEPGETKAIDVTLQTADSFCHQHQIKTVHLLKSDTQGADLTVLRGAEQLISDLRIPLILVEVLFTPLYKGQASFEEIYKHLTDRGFSFVNTYSVIHDKLGRAAWGDILFVNPEALKRLS